MSGFGKGIGSETVLDKFGTGTGAGAGMGMGRKMGKGEMMLGIGTADEYEAGKDIGVFVPVCPFPLSHFP